ELKYRVDFVYVDGDVSGETQEKYWKHFNRDVYHEQEKFIDRDKAMQRAVAEIVQPDDPPETKLRKIYARVQRINNETYEPRKTEQELKRREPHHNVEEVWTAGSGTASQLNYLFVALARAAGLQADRVLVATRDEYFFDERLMNSRMLNSDLVL